MKKPLDERQRTVLEWVGSGCPEVSEASTAYKVSCQALENRGLVRVVRRSGRWSALLTDAGSHYLTHDTYPTASQGSLGTAMPQSPSAVAPEDGSQAVGAGPLRAVRRSRRSFTEQLLEKLEEAGGRIVKTGPESDSWPSRVAAARRSGRIPENKELYAGWCQEGYEIRLVDIPAWRLVALEPVAVPARLTHPHPVVRVMQKASQPLGLTGQVRSRALRLVHALLTALEGAGHTTAAGEVAAAPPSHRRNARPHFMVTGNGQTVGCFLVQGRDREEHVPTERELAEAGTRPWVRIPRFDYTPSPRLRLILTGGVPHRASEWTDLAEHPLEEQLAEIVQEIGLRTEAAERKRLAGLKAARDKHLRWEAAMTQAREQYAEAYRAARLELQEAAWRRAGRLGAYLRAARDQVAALPPGPEKTQADAWLKWAGGYVSGLQAAGERFRLPEVPEPQPEDLKPYLQGWSPYGPTSRDLEELS